MDKQNQSDECREAFEAEVAGKLHLGRNLPSGEYRTEVTRLIYVGWCACWNRHTSPSPAEVGSEGLPIVASKELLETIKPRPVDGSLDDYWYSVCGEGPQAYRWSDTPHRLVYDLIANVLFYAQQSPARVEGELTDEEAESIDEAATPARMRSDLEALFRKSSPYIRRLMRYADAWEHERALNQRLAVKKGEAEINANRYLAIRDNALAKHTVECGRIPDATRFNKGYDEAADYMVKHGPANHIAHPVSDDQQAKDAALENFDATPAFYIDELTANTIKNTALINGKVRFSNKPSAECTVPVHWSPLSTTKQEEV